MSQGPYKTPEGVATHDYATLEAYDADGFPDSLDDVIDLLQHWRAKWSASGDMVVEFKNGYDGDPPEISLMAWVARPPAVVEGEVRRAQARKRNEALHTEGQERRQLKELLDKYGEPK